MIGQIPTSLTINGVDYKIRSDFRVAIAILSMFNNSNITDTDKFIYTLKCLYCDYKKIPLSDYEEAFKQASWFLDGGNMPKTKISEIKTFDWEYDECILFPAINDVAKKEVRELDYLHWWTFLGYFMSIGESLFSTVLDVRKKRAKGKKLEKWEKEFYNENKNLVNITTDEEKAEIAETETFIESLLKRRC